MKPLCIYHGHCDDGFAAAWVVDAAFRYWHEAVELYPGIYQQEPPEVRDRDVILVDFSYKRPVLDAMMKVCNSLLILDHHKTAQEDLSDMPPAAEFYFDHRAARRKGGIFDMNRSGAGLAWDYFMPTSPRPAFINYIEDRDLWRKSMPGGDEFTMALRSYPQNIEVWDGLVASGPKFLIGQGEAIMRFYRMRISELKRSAYMAALGGHQIAIANAPYFAASELAGELCAEDGAAFGACYFEVSPGAWQYSLRSRDDFDVSEVAKMFGGGGHKNAAGFTVKGAPAHLAGRL